MQCETNQGHQPSYVKSMIWVILLLLLLSRFSRVRLCATPQMAAQQAPRPWDSPGKNTGVGCHFFLQCVKVKSESEVTQSSPTLRNPMDCSLPGSSVHGIFQARVLEWGAISFSKINRFREVKIAKLQICNKVKQWDDSSTKRLSQARIWIEAACLVLCGFHLASGLFTK